MPRRKQVQTSPVGRGAGFRAGFQVEGSIRCIDSAVRTGMLVTGLQASQQSDHWCELSLCDLSTQERHPHLSCLLSFLHVFSAMRNFPPEATDPSSCPHRAVFTKGTSSRFAPRRLPRWKVWDSFGLRHTYQYFVPESCAFVVPFGCFLTLDS